VHLNKPLSFGYQFGVSYRKSARVSLNSQDPASPGVKETLSSRSSSGVVDPEFFLDIYNGGGWRYVTKARAASARSRPLGPGPSDLALGGQLAAPALHCTCTASGGHGASERGGAPGARSIKGALLHATSAPQRGRHTERSSEPEPCQTRTTHPPTTSPASSLSLHRSRAAGGVAPRAGSAGSAGRLAGGDLQVWV